MAKAARKATKEKAREAKDTAWHPRHPSMACAGLAVDRTLREIAHKEVRRTARVPAKAKSARSAL